jgi:hypothetical protein
MNGYEDESPQESRERTTDVSNSSCKFPVTLDYALSVLPKYQRNKMLNFMGASKIITLSISLAKQFFLSREI